MFSNDYQLRKIQELCLEALKETIRVCNENNLTYFLCGGTLLGAIRHHGFIPWDDDIDVLMPRDDYEKLIKIANSEFSSDFALEHYSLCKAKEEVHSHHVQVVNKKMDLIRKWTKKEEIIHPWVDIFPLDGMPNNVIMRNLHYYHYRFWHNCMQLSFFDQNVDIHKKRPFFADLIVKFIDKTGIGNNWNTINIIDRMERIAKKYPTDYGNYVCSFHGIYNRKEMLKSKIFSEKILYEFEDQKYCIMKDYDENLSNYYGEYMKYDGNQTKKHSTQIVNKVGNDE